MLTRLINTIGLFTRAQYEHQVELNKEADNMNEIHIEHEKELTTERDKADTLAMRYKSMLQDTEEELASEHKALKAEMDKRFEIEKERLSLIDTNEKLNEHISVLDKKLMDSVRSHNTAALRVNSLETEIEKLNATIDENVIKISDLTHACDEYVKTISKLNEKLAGTKKADVKVKVDKAVLDKAVKAVSDKAEAIRKASEPMEEKPKAKTTKNAKK